MLDVKLKFVLVFLSSLILSALFTRLMIFLAKKWDILDRPGQLRKIHQKAIPLLGGWAIYAAILVVVLYLWWQGQLIDAKISASLVFYFLVAGLILMISGFFDDKFSLSSKISILGPLIASSLMLFAGLKIAYLTSWQGGIFYLEHLFDNFALANFLMFALTFFWLLGTTYTTKILDGLDGLASSIGLVASLVIFIVSLSWDVSGSTTSLLSLSLAGAILGFLIFNWHPAKIFLGEAGSTFIGFSLGVLAIISGSKIATALLVMGLPALDILWVIVHRLKNHQAFWQGDNQHLHFRLLRVGFSQQQVVLFISFLSLLFGLVSIFFTTRAKLGALLILLALMFVLSAWLNYRLSQKDEEIS
ncbi:undecaprenyl/decaprenyl-phosphate alpha-N-acetylglucosaminyl 1-phosphate transferase [Candidatus Nomurabacteria bacterium]|nr:undecaprenyl/decaprenyl-phosphate alpha-N-acetylglucosaminyl 1-phosphate transferase [Candidatus Nomurabacteria bacterium]